MMDYFKRCLLFLVLTFGIGNLSAQSIRQLGNNLYWAGIPENEFNFIQAQSMNGGKQMQSNWCWAASVQMVLNYHGLFVDQINVVQRIYGHSQYNATATEAQILSSLRGWAPDRSGRKTKIVAEGGQSSIPEIIKELAYKWPLIVGLQTRIGGHALVLTGIYYQVDSTGEFIPIKVELRDPWPGIPSRQELSWENFEKACTSLIKVAVKPQMNLKSQARFHK